MSEHEDHGSTPAAWTAVAIIVLAFVLGTIAIILGNWVLFWVGVALVPIGVIIGKVMSMAGLGARQS